MTGVVRSDRTRTLIVSFMLVEIMLLIYAGVTGTVFMIDGLATAAFMSMAILIIIVESLVYDIASNIDRIAETRHAAWLGFLISIVNCSAAGLFLSFLSIYMVFYHSLTGNPLFYAIGAAQLLLSIAVLFYGAIKHVKSISIPLYHGILTHKNGALKLSQSLRSIHVDLTRLYVIVMGLSLSIMASIIQSALLVIANILVIFIYITVIIGAYSATSIMGNIIEYYIGASNEPPDEKARRLIEMLIEEKVLSPLPILVQVYLSRSYNEQLIKSIGSLLTRISRYYPVVLFTDSLNSPLARMILGKAVEQEGGEPQLYVSVYTKSVPYPRLMKRYRIPGGFVVGVYEHALSLSHFINIVETVRKTAPMMILLDNVNMMHMLLDVPPSYINTFRFIKTLISRLKHLDVLLMLYDPSLGQPELTNLLIINSVTVIPFTELPLILDKLFRRLNILVEKKAARPEIIEDLTREAEMKKPI